MKRKKRKGRIKWNRIIYLITILTAFIFSIRVINYIKYNNKLYDNILNSSATNVNIDKKYDTLKIYQKTYDMIKSDNVSVVINDGVTKTYLDSKNVKLYMDLNVNTYNTKVNYSGFDNNEAFFIENKGIVSKSSKVEINLPNYLKENKIVDIYGIRENDKINQISLGVKVKDVVILKPSDKYVKYFITYVPLTDMKVKDLTVDKGDVINLNIKYVPENATVKDYEYTKIGDIFMLNSNGNIVAKESGSDTIEIKHTIQNIEKKIKVTVRKEEEVTEEKVIIKDGLTYVDGILIANKTYSLPSDYDPGELNEDALNSFEEMKADALKDDIELWIQSGYRSYSLQEELYNRYVEEDGKDLADTYSARPGHSEHQTGLAMDLNIIDSSFEGTPEAIWLEENCYKYGFIIRYPKGKEKITGYMYEPWHLRYIGKENAKKVYESGLTLEEYLGIDSKYSNE